MGRDLTQVVLRYINKSRYRAPDKLSIDYNATEYLTFNECFLNIFITYDTNSSSGTYYFPTYKQTLSMKREKVQRPNCTRTHSHVRVRYGYVHLRHTTLDMQRPHTAYTHNQKVICTQVSEIRISEEKRAC